MEFMIPGPLVLPEAALSLAVLEDHVQTRGQTLMQQALATAWATQAPLQPIPPCPTCGATTTQSAGRGGRLALVLLNDEWSHDVPATLPYPNCRLLDATPIENPQRRRLIHDTNLVRRHGSFGSGRVRDSIAG